MVEATPVAGGEAVSVADLEDTAIGVMMALMAALTPYATDGDDTVRKTLARMPSDHFAHKLGAITVKCEACGALHPLSRLQWRMPELTPQCEVCGAASNMPVYRP
jgi:hypothetical protein